MQQKPARRNKEGAARKLESFLERTSRKLNESNARELEDYVKKQRKVYVTQLNSPSVEAMTSWPGWLEGRCGGFGKRGSEEGEEENEVVAAESGLKKRPLEMRQKGERTENFDIGSGREEEEIQSVTDETWMEIKRFVAKHGLTRGRRPSCRIAAREWPKGSSRCQWST